MRMYANALPARMVEPGLDPVPRHPECSRSGNSCGSEYDREPSEHGFRTRVLHHYRRSPSPLLGMADGSTKPSGLPRGAAGSGRFEISRDNLAGLQSVWFVLGSAGAADLEFGFSLCRWRPAWAGAVPPCYDVVIGPVASQWRQQRAFMDKDQISFHSAKAVTFLDAGVREAWKRIGKKWVVLPLITASAKNAFWKVVEECLVQIHHLPPTRAR